MNDGVLATENLGYRAGGSALLSGATLRFCPGEITAILGPSGSGKSTLLKCLTSVYLPSDGDVVFGGEPVDKNRRQFRQQLGYVPQDDVIHTGLRVEQAFYYAAKLRLDTSLSAEEVEARIAAIAEQLGLAERRRHRIRRLSGGQRKRVNIGVELLADPTLLILDEPASGLDPGTEEDLLKYLRVLADAGKTVVLTTHSMEYLEVPDRLVVLMAGRVVYWGTLEGMLAHFGISHAADVFKTLRQQDVEFWAGRL